MVSRMQVEVSKHTEGKKENALRPNGLPESLIRYGSRPHSPFISITQPSLNQDQIQNQHMSDVEQSERIILRVFCF